ncbi:unnamed protein product [Lymnaea stagnalis]|uniref:GPI ethanolamine phosphate transferase 1 n=1 Tax=Lymnaea stagnalis TaxID=6523 RepID=A0AAV2IL38_LYMST
MSYTLYLLVLEHTEVGQARTAHLATSQNTRAPLYAFLAVGLAVTFLLYVQSLSVMCYVYCLLPLLLWYKSYQGLLSHAVRSAVKNQTVRDLAVSLLFCVAGLEIVIQSFYHRELLSLVLLAMSAWPVARLWWYEDVNGSKVTAVGWSLTCLLVAVYPFLPVVRKETQYNLVIHYKCRNKIIFIIKVVNRKSAADALEDFIMLIFSQIFLVCLSVVTVKLTSDSITRREGLPLVCQLSSWFILGCGPFLPMMCLTNLRARLFSLSLGFFAPYLLLSITYEGLFIVSLFSLLYFWLEMEYETNNRSGDLKFEQVDFRHEGLVKDNITSPTFSRHLELSDLRRAFFFIFLVLIAFFGTGNIASINSFDPVSVYCFLTVFNPFLMGSLLMLKNVMPLLIVICTFRGVHVLTSTPLRSLFLIVLLMSDFMGLHFFFMVKDYGSWLDIGTTISHYVIVMLMNIFLLVFTGLSHGLTCWRIHWTSRREKIY